MHLEATSFTWTPTARKTTADSARKQNAGFIPLDVAALSVIETHGTRACFVVASWVWMHFYAGPDALGSEPLRTGHAPHIREGNAREIPRDAAALWTLVADCVAARWIETPRTRMHQKGRFGPRASSHGDADNLCDVDTRLSPAGVTAGGIN